MAASETSGQVLGSMYARWTLDVVVRAAHAVSIDFGSRPQLYREVPDEIAEALTALQSETGFDAQLPNSETRIALMAPIYGASDGNGLAPDGSTFKTTRLTVLIAAAAFSENAQPTAFPMHRERIRSALVPLRSHLRDIQGSSQQQTAKRISSIFSLSTEILRNGQIAGVFGVQKSIDDSWPLGPNDTEGAKLLANISAQLPGGQSDLSGSDEFIRLQRVAAKGAQAIRIILDSDIESDDKVIDEQLTPALYAWGSDLGVIGGGS